jgi:hypothetical protein
METKQSLHEMRLNSLRDLFQRKPRRWLAITGAEEIISALRAEGMGITARDFTDQAKFYYYDPKMRIQVEQCD